MLDALLPVPYNGKGIGYTCVSLCSTIQGEGVKARVFTPMVRRGNEKPILRAMLPKPCQMLPYRFVRRFVRNHVEEAFLRESTGDAIAYLWSDVSPQLSQALKDRGVLVVREKFNCHQAVAAQIMREAYDRLGWEYSYHLNEASVARELEALRSSDYVFSPSPEVRKSLLAGGISDDKIIASSYGWDPKRLRSSGPSYLPKTDGVTFLFVGMGSVRKGLPWLLDAWVHADIDGRLVLAGGVSPDVEKHCGELLQREDIVCLPYVSDIGSVYRSADVFVFPSLEEGGPQVTYEAMAYGLPVVVSPMGAGAVARDGIDAIVCDPLDRDALCDALVRLASDRQLRVEMGGAGRTRANEFTWEKVGAKRRKELVTRCQRPSGGAC